VSAVTTTAPLRAPVRLLAVDRRRGGWDPSGVVRVDAAVRGAVALRVGAGAVARAEPGPAGPLRLHASLEGGALVLEVSGPESTSTEAAEGAMAALALWVGAGDDPDALLPLLAPHPRLRDIARRVGPVRLGALPAVGEAFGRAVLAQLVQAVEARRSMAQLAARAGTPAGRGLWCWPDARQVGGTPAWTLRRCGISLRAARALHAGAVEAGRLEAARSDPARFDARLRALPGVGVWTAAKTRAALGDADAVPVGDWNLPARVCTALTGEDRGRTGWTDDDLLELLAPFEGQRARVIRLASLAASRGLLPRARRRAPRAPRSAHRYW
jgi:3-methyladenine DNA glycosylase/8-oxoguanine DNA glycosylase